MANGAVVSSVEIGAVSIAINYGLKLNLDTAKSQVADITKESRKFRCAWHYAAACRGV
jgi:hypothetical protein